MGGEAGSSTPVMVGVTLGCDAEDSVKDGDGGWEERGRRWGSWIYKLARRVLGGRGGASGNVKVVPRIREMFVVCVDGKGRGGGWVVAGIWTRRGIVVVCV